MKKATLPPDKHYKVGANLFEHSMRHGACYGKMTHAQKSDSLHF